jgi:hypothetical protein
VTKGPRLKHTIRLSTDLSRRIADTARSRRVSQIAIFEAALESFLSPDGSDRLEAALSRRLDRITRDLARMNWDVLLTNEALALFIRFWLTNNPPLVEASLAAAQAMGTERWSRFVDALSRRMELGPTLRSEIHDDVLSKKTED